MTPHHQQPPRHNVADVAALELRRAQGQLLWQHVSILYVIWKLFTWESPPRPGRALALGGHGNPGLAPSCRAAAATGQIGRIGRAVWSVNYGPKALLPARRIP